MVPVYKKLLCTVMCVLNNTFNETKFHVAINVILTSLEITSFSQHQGYCFTRYKLVCINDELFYVFLEDLRH